MVLVLEDDKSTREMLAEVLKYFDFDHVIASTSEEAISFMKQFSPAVFITDLLLVDGDARDAVNYCQNVHKNCKTILVTAAQPSLAKNAAETLNTTHLLLKPFDIEELIRLLI